MEQQRNWLSWAALALAGLALLVAFSGRFSGPRMVYSYESAPPAMPMAPAAPRFERGHGDRVMPFDEQLEREIGPRGRGGEGFGPGFQARGFDHGPGFGRGHGFGPLGMIFGLLGLLSKLAALGLLAWLLLRLFQQRRAGAPPAAPTTPAGHDPRVE
jgi:hypothetical protein